MPDTGASVTIVSLDITKAYGIRVDPTRKVKLYAANGTRIACDGACTLFLKCDGWAEEVKVRGYASRDVEDDIMLCWKDMIKTGIISPNFPEPVYDGALVASVSVEDQMAALTTEYQDIFGDFFKGPLKPMNGPPMKIQLRTDTPIKPKKVLTARPIPLHVEEAANELVQKSLEYGIIRRVEEPTDWVAAGFFVTDPGSGNVRLVTDFGDLGEACVRPIQPFPSPADVMRKVRPDSKVFAKIDATKGYFQLPLDEESQLLTTFLLPSGRYCYTRAPMGLSVSLDWWVLKHDTALRGLDGVQTLLDDVLVEAPDFATLLKRIAAVFERFRAHGITISEKKFEYGDRVKFAGYIVTAEGVQADPEKLRAIREFPPPQDVHEVRSFLGLANQLGSFLPDLAHATKLLRDLLKKDTAFVWLPEHQAAFEETCRILTSAPMTQFFDMSLPTELLTDASRTKGLGYALIQRTPEGEVRLISCGSRSLSSAESRYATIELEALAITYGIQNCHYYLFGMPRFTVLTDHRPLEGVFRKDLQDIKNSRLQRLRLKVCDYAFDVQYTPGKTHLIADALSRAPIFDPAEEEEADVVVCAAMYVDPALEKLSDKAKDDPEYMQVVSAFQGKTCLKDLPPAHPAHAYASIWDDISMEHGLLVYNDRIVIPAIARREILDLLHIPHNGIEKTRVAARQLYFWPNMNNEVKQLIEVCEVCQRFCPAQQKETLQPTSADGLGVMNSLSWLTDFQVFRLWRAPENGHLCDHTRTGKLVHCLWVPQEHPH
jgi:hypothetical protein